MLKWLQEPYIVNSCEKLLNKNVLNNLKLILSSVRMLLNFAAWKFWCILFLAILKTNRFSQHLS